MREVKEKSSLKARAVETLKSAPRAAFRRGTDASFQQLRQELREAAQDGQPEDRYESGKITDTADHAVRQAEHMAERAVRKSAIWQKRQPTGCRKQNPNRSGKPGQNLFHNMSSLGTPCSLLRHRKNIRLRLRDRATRHRASRR